MSQENVEVVRRSVDAFSGGDLDNWLAAYCADDIDYRAAEGALDDRGPMHGKDAVRAYAQDWLDMFDDLKVEPVELIDAGEDQVIAVLRNSGRAKLSSWRGLRILRKPSDSRPFCLWARLVSNQRPLACEV